jgi:hypothetical protein
MWASLQRDHEEPPRDHAGIVEDIIQREDMHFNDFYVKNMIIENIKTSTIACNGSGGGQPFLFNFSRPSKTYLTRENVHLNNAALIFSVVSVQQRLLLELSQQDNSRDLSLNRENQLLCNCNRLFSFFQWYKKNLLFLFMLCKISKCLLECIAAPQCLLKKSEVGTAKFFPARQTLRP